MSIRVFYCNLEGELWRRVAVKLHDTYAWTPCYCSAEESNKPEIMKQFSEVIFHDTFDAIRAIPPNELEDMRLEALDQQLLVELSYHESILLKMMDRMDTYGDSFTYPDRIRLYHFLIRYWMTVLKKIRPELIVFPSVPHTLYDYVVYILAQKLNIRTILFGLTSMDGYTLPMEKIDEPTLLQINYSDLLQDHAYSFELSETTKDYLNRLRGPDYSKAAPSFSADYAELVKEKGNQVRSRFYRSVQKASFIPRDFMIRLNASSSIKKTYWKKKGRSFENSVWTDKEYRRMMLREKYQRAEFEKYYRSLTDDYDPNVPFVYIALHYQPEQTTSPSGDMFVHQYLLVDLISKIIPDDWQIYVKEHYYQFVPNRSLGNRSRTYSFYDDLADMPNVKLVPIETAPWDLIDNCQCSASVTGTTGWESVVRGKPSLIFGHVWYRGCEGVFYTPNANLCKQAIDTIIGGYQVDYKKVQLFAHILEKIGCRGYSRMGKKDKKFALSMEENVNALSEAITKMFYERNNSEIDRVDANYDNRVLGS